MTNPGRPILANTPASMTFLSHSYIPSGWIPLTFTAWGTVFVSSSGFQLRQRFFSHVARKGFRFGKGVPLSLFGFAS